MAIYKHLHTTMSNKSFRIIAVVTLVAFCALFLSSCNKTEDNLSATIEGRVCESFITTSGISGVRVTLRDISGIEADQVAVTGGDGIYSFNGLSQRTYTIEAEKDGWHRVLITPVDSWESTNYNNSTTDNHISVEPGETKIVMISMLKNSSSGGSLEITDRNGNPICENLTVPRGETSVGVWLKNNSSNDVSWNLSNINWTIGGYNDTVYYPGTSREFPWHTDTYYFSPILSISPEEGVVGHGSATLVTIHINLDMYKYDYYTMDYVPFSLYYGLYNSLDFNLYFPSCSN